MQHQNQQPVILFDPYPRSRELIFRSGKWNLLQSLGRVVHSEQDTLDSETIDANLPEAVALIGQTEMTTERLSRAKKLKAIFNVEGNFLANVDYETCFQRGIHVLSAGPAFANSVAESALGFALDLLRGITVADRNFRKGTEKYGLESNLNSSSLMHSDVGFIGFGNLAQALLPLLAPFYCRIRVFDPWLPDAYILDHHCEPASLEEVLSNSVVIFILSSVTNENERLLNIDKLSLIRRGASVILLSRAEAVDFDALVSHVDEGHFQAAIDVFPVEPVPENDPIRQMEGLLLSAHRTGSLRDAFFRIGDMTIDDLSLILSGLPPKRMQAAQRETVARFRSKPGRSYRTKQL